MQTCLRNANVRSSEKANRVLYDAWRSQRRIVSIFATKLFCLCERFVLAAPWTGFARQDELSSAVAYPAMCFVPVARVRGCVRPDDRHTLALSQYTQWMFLCTQFPAIDGGCVAPMAFYFLVLLRRFVLLVTVGIIF